MISNKRICEKANNIKSYNKNKCHSDKVPKDSIFYKEEGRGGERH